MKFKQLQYKIFLCLTVSLNIVVLNSTYLSAQTTREVAFESRKEILESQHRRVYALPLSQDFIHNELMPQIREERKAVAPHFPERGVTSEATDANIRNWLTTYPEELDAYVNFVNNKIAPYIERKSRN